MHVRTDVTTDRGPSPDGEERTLRILHLIVTLGHANAQFNEHCLPARHERALTICSFHPRSVEVPPEIRVFEGDGTVRGFLRALGQALDSGPYDVVHAHAPGTGAALVAMRLWRRSSMANAVLTVHNTRQSFPLRNQMLLAPLLAAFPTVVFCSASALTSFPRAMRRLARRVVVVPNGVDLARIDRALAEVVGPPATSPFRVVAVGRLIARKDPDTLVAAFGMARDATDELVFVGDGAERAEVLGRAAAGGMGDRVAVTGTVERDAVYGAVADAGVFVSTSRSEGLPVSVLEAMACARPVVLSDIPSHREIASGDDVVPLVPVGDARGFATAIARIKTLSPDERTSVGNRCRTLIAERFSLETMQRRYERVYREVVAANERRMAKGVAA
jgi:glycosyltransferase involved in cell wall biosynthesis